MVLELKTCIYIYLLNIIKKKQFLNSRHIVVFFLQKYILYQMKNYILHRFENDNILTFFFTIKY